MKTIVLVFLSWLISSTLSFGQSEFNRYFTDKALRYDFELLGSSETVQFVPVQIKVLPQWGGQPNACIDELNFGNYNFELYDAKSGQLIFRKGFCTLFGEWQTTAEAKSTKRTFYQALYFPKPIGDVKMVVHDRDEQNAWSVLFQDTLRAANYFAIQETPTSYPLDTIVYNGSVSNKIDVVILAEGYTRNEMGKFLKDARRLTDSLFAAEPFKKYRKRFNVWAAEVPSLESGTDIPGNRVYKNTAFNSHFYTFDSPRYLTVTDTRTVYDVLDGIPFDHIYVLVNTSRYGGGGFYNFLNVCSSDNARSPFVFCHEFGHGFAGLGDEYYSSSTSYEEFFAKTKEPWEPNLTTMVNFDSKWKKMIKRGMPVPTPRDSVYLNKVGVFEGGGYEAKGIYSPSMTCWMKEMKAGNFCPVCEDAIIRVILSETD